MERLTRKRRMPQKSKGILSWFYSLNSKQELVDALATYEDTGLTPEQIMELKDRDKSKPPEEIQDAFGDVRLICPNCRNSVINYFNQSRPPRFCMICGQRLNWEECNGKGNMQHEL